MNVTQMKVGGYYRIDYRKVLPSIYHQNAEKPIRGIGKLVKLNDGRYGWHSFNVENVGIVYASSRSVFSSVGPKNMPTETKIVDDPPSAEIEKLIQLGFDDNLRQEAVESMVLSFEGLGVTCVANENWSGITIPFVGLMNLKALINTLYSKSLERDLEELEQWH